MAEHSVSSHLRLDTQEYDRIIRTYIPHYDESRGVQLDFLAAVIEDRGVTVLDLGGGTGSLAEAVLDRFPRVNVVVRDIDPQMLDVARGRLERFGARVRLDWGSFDDPLPAVDAVLSAFALHHVPRLEQKVKVYANIRAAIRSGGVFLNNDATSGPFWPQLREEWARFMASRGFTLAEGYQNLDDWAAEDTYFSAREELRAMSEAGFADGECLWRRGPTTILGAKVA
jgi:ubiquinone/menaquinone biosynthesis C-methylase UbiE